MKTYKIPVTFYIKARSPENAESTLMGALGYLEWELNISAELNYLSTTKKEQHHEHEET